MNAGLRHDYQIRLVKKEASGREMYHLICEVPEELYRSFRTVGQYASLRALQKTGFFALANAPRASSNRKYWEFLIKDQGQPAQELCKVKENALIAATPAMGEGFALPQMKKSQAKPAKKKNQTHPAASICYGQRPGSLAFAFT